MDHTALFVVIGVMLVVGTIAACRIVGFAFDGLNRVTVVPFVVELIMVAILLTGARRLPSN